MQIDSHQHFWIYNTKQYQWIDDSMSKLRRNFLPADLKRVLDKNDFDGSVAVQAKQSVEETRWLLKLADKNDFIKGVVGWLPFVDENFEVVLEELISNSKLKGGRHVLQDEPDDLFMLRQPFINNIGKLKKYNLTYDILIFPRHIKYARELLQKFPEQRFVIDHIAKPLIKKCEIEPWKSDIFKLAKFDNTYCKLSGMVTEANFHSWKKSDFTPYMEVVLNAFGDKRIMFGSDWPVCTVCASYEQVLEIIKDFIGNLSIAEQNRIMGGNAVEFYNLESMT